MRILRISQNLYPEQPGGASYHVHAMSRDQAEMGHEVTVITTRNSDDLPRVETRDGYEIRRFDTLVSPLGNDISVGLARYLRQASEFDVIHAHSHLYFSTNLAALKRRLGHIPLAITNHGLYSQSAPERVFRLYLKTLGRWTFNRADLIFCYTDMDRRRVREFGVSSRIEVVSNGIDTELFSPNGSESELIDASGPVVLFVGRFTEGKRPGVAIEAFADVLKEHPNAELYLCGDGPLCKDLKENVIELQMESSVTFLGHVHNDAMPEVYRSADVLVLPSRAEGVPRTVIEALSTGVPVVCSDLRQFHSAFGDAVTYVSEIDAFGEHVVDVLTQRMNPSGLSDRFCWSQTVTETTEAMAQIDEGTE